jgi:alanyl-tRNA synthetase
MTSSEIRQQFLDFFKSKEHRIVPSSPVVPFDDPTLLFTNAGMNQFKDVFLGLGSREYKRASDTQKCIRVSGKHNDLEEVGHDTYHHTFFEMLGNWSFGDYYKPEAISWAWELLTEVWKLPKERLWATVYRTDNEAFDLWKTKTDINPKHILLFDEKDNFWEMGETGPCGPCSEIHINLSDDYDNPKYVNAGVPECIEIWNLVFIQYNRDNEGKLHDLPAKHIDTGMGFERVCAVMQKKNSNYDTDVFTPLINAVSMLSGIKYEKEEEKTPMRVISDHIRTLTFAIADGAVPGNDGRGYVLRRILRRAARYGRKLNLNKPFLFELVKILVDTMGSVFPEIVEKQGYIEKVIKAEEESFNATLDRGIELFEELIKGLSHSNNKIIPGKDVFMLYDTFGFPVDLTNVMAKEIGFSIDEAGFNELMDMQKQRARDASKDKFASVNISTSDLSSFELINEKKSSVQPGKSEFTGYDELKSKAKIIGHKKEDKNDLVILDKTPFYVEAGGQIDDLGSFIVGESPLSVIDVTKIDNKVIHVLDNEKEYRLTPGMDIIAEVDKQRRWDIMRNHSATHFLDAALRKILGTHVHQAGSYVGPDRLRFDFTHFAKVSESELRDIETLVNEQLRLNIPLQHHRNVPFDEAKKMGALMFFGDKYGDFVNVVQFGDFSMEFCGGTHVKNSSQIGLFKITGESSIASGVRRIEAVTGAGVENYIISQMNHLKQSEEKITELLEEKKKLEKEISEFKLKGKLGQIDSVIEKPMEAGGIKIYKAKVNAENMDELKSFGDELRNKIKNGVGVLFTEIEGKVGIVCVVSDELIKEKKLSAGKIVGELAKLVGGGGGGRPHLATAGGKDISMIPSALNEVEKIITKFLSES